MLLLLPFSATCAWSGHNSEWHLDHSSEFFVDDLGFLQSHDLEFQSIDLMLKSNFVDFRVERASECDPFEMLRKLDSFVVREIEWLLILLWILLDSHFVVVVS